MRALIVMVVALLCSLGSSVAHADKRFDAHFGGGLEGGLIGSGHPGGVVQAGIAGAWVGDHELGIGFAIDTFGRSGVDLTTYEEDTFDLMLRVAEAQYRLGVGAGLRVLTPEAIDGRVQPTQLGIDMIRLDASLPIAQTALRVIPAQVGVDAYFSWQFGCYLAANRMSTTSTRTDGPQPSERTPGCSDTITSTYVVGLQFELFDR